MQNRRMFLKSCAAMSIGVPFVGRCSPMKSMIAAEKNFREDEYSPFDVPYITDGMLAMWDGEWNVGWGVHDSTATSWVDLSGHGFDFPIPKTGVEWNNQSLSLAGGTSLNRKLPEEQRKSFTVECVAIGTGVTGAFLWLKNPSWNGGALLGWASTGRCYFPWTRIGDLGDRDLQSASLSWDSTRQTLVRDGIILASTSHTVDVRNILSSIYVGEYNGGFMATMEVFSVRLYNRALTPEEIAHNYAVDKERFFL